jgi:PAS domain S-box-containing protein
VVVAGTGVAVLLGWVTESTGLVCVVPGWPPMAPLAALSFVLVGISLFTLVDRVRPDGGVVAAFAVGKRQLSGLCAMAVILIAALRLVDHVAGYGLIRDLLWFEQLDASNPARMTPATTVGLLASGCALLMSPRLRSASASQAVAVGIGLLGWLGVSHFLYGGAPLWPFERMAVHSATLFLPIAVGLLALRANNGMMALILSDTQGGAIARRLVPVVLFAPIVLGWLQLQGERLGWFGTEAGVSIVMLGNMLVFGALTWTSARRLHRSELERRHARQTEHEKAELLQVIADHSAAVIYVKDLAGRYLFVNQRFAEVFNLTREGIVSKLDHDLFTPAIADAFRAMDVRAAQSDSEIIGEELAPHDDGLHTYLSVKCRLHDVRGRVYATLGVSTDITERKEAEAALRQSEQRFRTLVETLPQLVWTCRPDGWCDFLSRQWVTYTGRSEAEQLGTTWAEHLHEDDRARVQAQWTEAVQHGAAFDMEFRIRRADGAYRWFKTHAIALRDASGNISKWFGSNTDIDDDKRSEVRLRSQLAHLNLLDRTTRAIHDRQDLPSIFLTVLRSLEDHLPANFSCICEYDRARNTLSVVRLGPKSLAAAVLLEMVEQTKIEVLGNGLARCIHGQMVYEPDVGDVGFPFLQRLARQGLRALVAAPLLVEGQVYGVMLIARAEPASFESSDCEFMRQLSEHVGLAVHQVQLYKALQSAYEDLRRTQLTTLQQERLRVVGQMASGIAHDINNALSPAALYVQSLLEAADVGEKNRARLEIIDGAIDAVSRTVTRLREFYRPQDTEISAPVKVRHLLEQVLELTRVRWQDMPQERGIVVDPRIDAAADLPAVQVSESELRDALTNLILNAVDAMPSGGILTLAARCAPDNKLCVEVRDTGVGMDEAARLRCLEPFFTTKGQRGTGLGLAMVYGMVQRHGGDIEIDSEIGMGTSMRLLLPVAACGPGAAEAAVVAAALPLQLHLLVVDDDPLVLETLKNVLTVEGHKIIVAEGGEAGIAAFTALQLRNEAVAAVITDLGMPHVDGRQVAAHVKATSPRTPVILLTGWGHRLLADKETPDHVDCILGKPPKLAELRRALTELAQRP